MPPRTTYPAEDRFAWLSPVLDAFAVSDDGQARELEREARRSGRRLACHAGCSACCKKPDVPILASEVKTISWYLCDVADSGRRQQLLPRLRSHSSRLECPFLLDERCSIYPVRPLGCRGLLVFSTPCAIGEDVSVTRPQDKFLQSRGLSRKIGLRILDAEEWESNAGKVRAFEDGYMPASAVSMHELNWRVFADGVERMCDPLRKLP